MSWFSTFLSHQGQLGRDLNAIGGAVAPVLTETVIGDLEASVAAAANKTVGTTAGPIAAEVLDNAILTELAGKGLVPASAVTPVAASTSTPAA